MGSTSKFIELSKKRLPHDKRTKRLYGEKDDTNKFFKCWHCGFIVDSTKHLTGDRTYLSFTAFPDWVNLMEMDSATAYQDEITDEGGNNILVGMDLYYSDISLGCPNCGCPNYR